MIISEVNHITSFTSSVADRAVNPENNLVFQKLAGVRHEGESAGGWCDRQHV